MSRQRVLATRSGSINGEKLWNEARAAWGNVLDISDVDGDIGFDFAGIAPTRSQVQSLVDAHDPSPLPPTPQELQVAADRNTLTAFMNAASGEATAAQRDDVLRAIIRYLRRRGEDA